uniref:ABC transporter permease n=1 Tax=Ascaris lumbricoides TaxID=6252 RepID=A0A0M3HN86_ASCLU
MYAANSNDILLVALNRLLENGNYLVPVIVTVMLFPMLNAALNVSMATKSPDKPNANIEIRSEGDRRPL